MSAIDELREAAKTLAYASVGAAALGFEYAQETAEKLAAHGKDLLDEKLADKDDFLKQAKETAQDSADSGLDAAMRSFFKLLKPEARKAWLERAEKICAELESEPLEVEVETIDDDADATE